MGAIFVDVFHVGIRARFGVVTCVHLGVRDRFRVVARGGVMVFPNSGVMKFGTIGGVGVRLLVALL